MPPAPTATTTAAPADDAYQRLREMILREHVLPNERLVETEFAARLGHKRANIRKALARLAQDGLVLIEPFKGATVRRITEREAVEVSEVRGALETLLARHAAERAGEPDKAELRRLQAAAHALLAQGDPVAVGGASRQVREALWRISGHATGRAILATINSQLVRIWFRAILMPGRAAEIIDHLEQVVEAVCAGRPDDAVSAMQRYHGASMAALKRAVRQQGDARSADHLP